MTIPDQCTLPTAEQPARVDAYDKLFRRHLRAVHRAGPTASIFTLDPDPAVAGSVAELVARESQCCAFFDFTLRVRSEQLALTVAVPARFSTVLAALSDRADAALSRR